MINLSVQKPRRKPSYAYVFVLDLDNFISHIQCVINNPNWYNHHKRKPIKCIFNAKVNGFKEGRIMLKHYYLKAGKYTIDIRKEQEESLGFVARYFSRKLFISKSTKFEYELKSTLPEFLLPFILLVIGYSISQLFH